MNVIKEPENSSFKKVGIKGKIFHTELTSTEFILIETEEGHETTIIEHEVDFTYYVIEGSGYFVINGVKEECNSGDLVVIPRGSKFTYKGKLKMLLNCTPPFWPEQEETLEG